MEALHDVVKAGKARYVGASSMYAWQFSKAQYLARAAGLTTFVSMQDHYNLLNREEEREMLPLCADLGVGVIPWSPLARGRLTRDWDEQTTRSQTDEFGKTLYQDGRPRRSSRRWRPIAAERGVPRAQVALAWVLGKPVVTAPIVGATKALHLEDAVAAVEPRAQRRRVRAARGALRTARPGRLLSGARPGGIPRQKPGKTARRAGRCSAPTTPVGVWSSSRRP